MIFNILITGGAGFIGSNLIRLFLKKYPNYKIYNMDILTYASDISRISDFENYNNYLFLKEDINNRNKVKDIFFRYKISHVIHLAAETHVDNSIKQPRKFVNTNIIGTLNLLEAAREYWSEDKNNKLFYHISTDEVYGSLGDKNSFDEYSRYDPKSPYSASKAASDHFVRSYANTYSIPIKISNCSNNYGPFQFPEKLIPMVILNIYKGKTIPVYGDGSNIRDWLHVDDHVNAIDLIFHNGKINETYNIGGSNEWRNIDLINLLVDKVDAFLGREKDHSLHLIKYVTDRQGHDYRYSINTSKLTKNLRWKPKVKFIKGITDTIKWYINNFK